MEQNELVIFENFSILNQKAMALPIGKVSIRQVLLITAGFALATILYLITTDLLYAGVSFAPFVVISMINTKIVSLDQIIRNNISFLIRGTSLSKRHLNSKSKSSDKTESKIIPINEKQMFSLDGIIQLLKSLFPKNKDKNNPKDDLTGKKSKEKKNKEKIQNHSVVLSVSHDNIITLSNLKTKNNKKLFSKKEKILDYLQCTLDGIKLEESDYSIVKESITIPLHKSKNYSITVNDENIIIPSK